MKRIVLKILFILSIIPYVLLIFGIINSYINGFGSTKEPVISTIWPARQYGYSAVKTYLYYAFYPKYVWSNFNTIIFNLY